MDNNLSKQTGFMTTVWLQLAYSTTRQDFLKNVNWETVLTDKRAYANQF